MKKIFVIAFTFISLLFNCSLATTNTEALLQYNRGIDYYKLGQYDESIVSFRKAITADPNFIDAYYNLGSVLEYLKQYDAALTVFKQIIVRNPNDYESVYKAAWISKELGDSEKAKTYLTLIPSYSSIYKDATALAAEMNFSLKDGKKTVPTASNSKIPSSNLLYENIPAPTGITSDNEGNIYVAEYTMNSILKITPQNVKSLYIKDAKIDGPIGLALDTSGNMYVANYNKNNVLKISPYGEISVLIGNVKNPYYLYISNNILFVSCQGSNSVLRYKL